MRSFLTSLLFAFLFVSSLKAERIYIMNSTGYNTAGANLIAAIIANGHTVDVNLVPPGSLPAGFTTSCVDPVNGYGWLCLFGNADYSALIPQLQIFIDAGGKVFYQYEVTCCTSSSTGAASVVAGLTGLPVVPNIEPYIALGGAPAYEGTGIEGCMTMKGNAYKGLDGIPVANQFQATANLGGSTPSIALCLNFGFHFATTDFVTGANNGALVGLGDVNAWYDGAEPSGTVNPLMVDFFFPEDCTDTCYLFPNGCVLETPTGGSGGSISLGNDTTMCNGNILTLNATTPSATYLWQDGSTGATLNVTASGTYWVQVNSACFGPAGDTIVVNYVSTPNVSLGNDTLLCPGSILVLDASSNGISYQWQDGSSDSLFSVSSGGIYWVQVGTNCGTFITDSISVNYFDPVFVDLGNDTTLCDPAALLLDATNTGVTYLWQDGSTNPTFIVSSAGIYWVEVNSICFGTISDSIVVDYISPATVSLGNDTVLCPGSPLVLDASSNASSYQWQDGSSDSLFPVSSAGIYWVQIGTNCGTFFTDSISVNYYDLVSVNIGNDTTICLGDVVMINATSPGVISYEWQDSSTLPAYLASAQGTYCVEVTGICNTDNDCMEVSIINPATFDLGNDFAICIGDIVTIGSPIAGATYMWQDTTFTSTYTVSQQGTYWVIVQVGSCQATDTIVIVEEDCTPVLTMPNVFTPNGDGTNNAFHPIEMENIENTRLIIFNRWGQEMFSSENLAEGWNGKFKGNECPEGVYFWIVNYTEKQGDSKTLSGNVTLLR